VPTPVPLKLLLVEDSARDAELTLLALERSGLELDPRLAHNHGEVAKLLETDHFDLILSDVVLPASSGEQVLSVVRERAPETPFIFISGVFGEEHAVKMMRQGATDYVLKQSLPLLPAAVKRAMAEVHERRQRRLAERNLHDAESRARIAIQAARMGTWEYNPVTGVLTWDERMRVMYELPANAPVSLDLFYSTIDEANLPLVRERVEAALNAHSDHTYQVEYRVHLPSGAERWFSSSGRSSVIDGRCVRFSGVLQDITAQKEATESLERLNDLLGDRVQKRTRERDRTWELSRELLAVLHFDLQPAALNPAWEATLGWPRGALAQMGLWGLVHPDDLAATTQEVENVAEGIVSSRFVNRMRHADGEYRWLSWTIVPDESMMYAVARDITSERAVLDELAATNERLREQIRERERVEAALQQMQRLEAVGQLTAGVAHDFNNLLTVILASANFLIRDLTRGNFAKFDSRLHSIQEAAERGARLTSQLLAFSRRQRLEPAAVSLNDTLSGMLDLLQRTLGGSIWIETETTPDLWNALVDATQTEMIILNLAINARDAMPNGGTLRVITANETITAKPSRPEDPEPGDYVVLTIQDSGSGMPPEVLAKAFEPFFTTKDVGKGSGLGLAQVFGFAKQSGGGVAIETVVGQGTAVKVYLPGVRAPGLSLIEPLPAESLLPPDGLRHRVLLVDDDPNVRQVTALLLDALGFAVVEADGAAQAMERLDDEIDLLLTDYAMPGATGAELARDIRQRYPDLPVVFITGYAQVQGLEDGHSLIVQKPFREEELAQKLRLALAAARAPQRSL
jgi:PAS domain S-box-containing protein